MKDIVLSPIPTVAEISPQLAAKFSDAQVLFYADGIRIPGNGDFMSTMEAFEASPAARNPAAPIGNDLDKVFTEFGRRWFSHALQNTPELYSNVVFLTQEPDTNATVYGFAAIAYPEQSSCPLNSDQVTLPKDFDQDHLIPASFAAVSVLYSNAAKQICIVAQNFVTASVVDDLTARHVDVSQKADAGKLIPESGFKLTSKKHKANTADQPLLERGSVIGSIVDPIGYLNDVSSITSYTYGTYISRLVMGGNNTEISSAPIDDVMTYMSQRYPAAKANLDYALAISSRRPQDVRWLAVTMTLPVSDAIRDTFPQP